MAEPEDFVIRSARSVGREHRALWVAVVTLSMFLLAGIVMACVSIACAMMLGWSVIPAILSIAASYVIWRVWLRGVVALTSYAGVSSRLINKMMSGEQIKMSIEKNPKETSEQ